MLRKIGLVLTACVGIAWIVLLVDVLRSGSRLEPGWSLAPVAVVVLSIEAFLAASAIWLVVGAVERILRLRRELRPPG